MVNASSNEDAIDNPIKDEGPVKDESGRARLTHPSSFRLHPSKELPPNSAQMAYPSKSPGPTRVASCQSHEIQTLPRRFATRRTPWQTRSSVLSSKPKKTIDTGKPGRKSNAAKAMSPRVATCRKFGPKSLCVSSSPSLPNSDNSSPNLVSSKSKEPCSSRLGGRAPGASRHVGERNAKDLVDLAPRVVVEKMLELLRPF
jgi:hypothetical protein